MSTTVFNNCNLFVGNEDKVLDNAWFCVDDESGRLTKLGTGPAPKADKNIDLNNQYVMSGLINAHTHIGLINADKNHYPEGFKKWTAWRCNIYSKLWSKF